MKGVSLSINQVMILLIAVMVGAVVLVVVLPLILNQNSTSSCVGPYRGVASVLADMTGTAIC